MTAPFDIHRRYAPSKCIFANLIFILLQWHSPSAASAFLSICSNASNQIQFFQYSRFLTRSIAIVASNSHFRWMHLLAVRSQSIHLCNKICVSHFPGMFHAHTIWLYDATGVIAASTRFTWFVWASTVQGRVSAASVRIKLGFACVWTVTLSLAGTE